MVVISQIVSTKILYSAVPTFDNTFFKKINDLDPFMYYEMLRGCMTTIRFYVSSELGLQLDKVLCVVISMQIFFQTKR